jgi:diguanylate cyclase (GGDEF)-like protein
MEQWVADLYETNEFLTSCVSTSDVFNFVADRIGRWLPFVSAELLLLDKNRVHLEVRDTFGDNRARPGSRVCLKEDPAGDCFSSGEALVADQTAAVPLKSGDQVFGVLRLIFEEPVCIDRSTLKAIGDRVSPVILCSLSMERSRANALTDVTTDLPNERAFHVILENQVAGAQRDQCPLSILAVDIKDFSDHNRRFGHPAGDRILNFAAQTIKDSLRQMDFIARSYGDEFLIVLPKATSQITDDIVRRIRSAFLGQTLKLSDVDSVQVELNFGSASFGPDGQTPAQLLTAARVRKTEAKNRGDSKVVFFPSQVVS